MKNIIVALDSFKGSLSSKELGNAVEAGIRNILPESHISVLPVADGGEGFVESLMQTLGGKLITVTVHDPLNNPTSAQYAIAADNKTAIIEMASASGISLIPYHTGNVMRTTTYGTGELISDALQRGCRNIILGIGGSATNDAGTGMLQALGYRILDRNGEDVSPGGEHLREIVSIDGRDAISELQSCSFTVATDVDNPFYGEEGAAYVFGPQKGATPEMVRQLDEGMRHLSKIVMQEKDINLQNISGSGAAGGLGGICHAFLGAQILPGIEFVLQQIHFDSLLPAADLVITGEGKIDRQTKHGKVISGIAGHAKAFGVPVVAITGNSENVGPELFSEGLTACFPIHPAPITLSEALDAGYTRRSVQRITEQIMRLLQLRS